MLNERNSSALFCDYYKQWIEVYKKDAIREATLAKYTMTHKWVEKLVPELKVSDLTRTVYQQLLNDYAKEHKRKKKLDFHHQLKGEILDAVHEGLIERDPTRKAIIKGKTPKVKKIKYLNQFELHTLIAHLDIKEEPNWDWFILLVAKTGMRFSEALAITPADFDFARQTLSVSKTWDYKGSGGFLPTKNKSSVRKIQIDWQIVVKFSELVKTLPDDKPIFVGENKIYNSTVNDVLSRHCKACGISVISIHGLRHTHASLLLFAGGVWREASGKVPAAGTETAPDSAGAVPVYSTHNPPAIPDTRPTAPAAACSSGEWRWTWYSGWRGSVPQPCSSFPSPAYSWRSGLRRRSWKRHRRSRRPVCRKNRRGDTFSPMRQRACHTWES